MVFKQSFFKENKMTHQDYILSPTAHNTTKMMKNSLYYGARTLVGYNPTTKEIIVSDSVSGLLREDHWNIQMVTKYPKHIYVFRLGDGKLHLYLVPTWGEGNYEPNQDIIDHWVEDGAELLAHTIHFHVA